jgi:glutathione reductase (NADPH)
MPDFEYDLFVVGAGSGGVRAARIAANHGARVAVAEEYRVGGTCVIRGCVPKKLLVYASRFHGDFEDAPGFGWNFPEPPRFDWRTLIANKDREIERLEAAYRANLDRAKVEIMPSRAVLEDRYTVRLARDGRRISARTILIATGARPFLPAIPGIEHAITSNEAFHLTALPRSVVVVGGGYIAVEFACIFNGLGAETTLIYRGDKILRGFDDDLRDDLTTAMRKRGVTVVTGATPTMIQQAASAKAANGTVRITLSSGISLSADAVMFATGRIPNTGSIGLEAAGVALGPNGEVVVDRNSRSSVENIYAVGDVTDRVALTPVAIREGHAFADSVFGGKPWTTEYDTIPTAVFSEPEIGTVGLPEHEARSRYGAIDVYKARFRPMKFTLSGRDERMLMKLLVDATSNRVVGCHVLGQDAGEIAQMAAVAMRMGATKADFDRTMALHPSAAEELVTMREKWQPTKT